MSFAVSGGARFIINDGFTEQLQDPNRPNFFLSDLNPNPATGQPSINPDDPWLKSATITVGPNGQTGTLSWKIPPNMTVWWQQNGQWVQVSDNNAFAATGDPINLLIEGIGIGTGDLVASFTPQGGQVGSDTETLTVYSPIDFAGPQAATLVQQIEAASGYDLTMDPATGEVYVSGGVQQGQLAAWQVQFRNYFYELWANEDTTLNNGVTTINTGPTPGIFGSFADQSVDTDDFAAVTAVNAQFGAAVLVHELVEQFDKQINGLPYNNVEGNDMSGGAHTDGILAESAVIGLPRTGLTVTPGQAANGDPFANFVVTFGNPPKPIYLKFTAAFPNTTITGVSVGP